MPPLASPTFLCFRLNRLRLLALAALLSLLNVSAVAAAQQREPYLLWPTPAPIQFLSPLTGVQLNAIALAGAPVHVPLESRYNVAGIATPGRPFMGGFDGNGESFSAVELGASLQWQGIAFPLGPADAPDVVSGTAVPLPAGTYSTLLLLADLVNDVQPGSGTITVHYTDGTSTATLQAFSDWVRARDNPGESNVVCVASRVFYDGSVEPNSTCVYGYGIALDPTKTVLSVDLPANRNILVLSMALLPPVLPGTFAYTPAAGAYPPVGTTMLQTVFTPQDTGFTTGAATVPLVVNAPVPALATSVSWATPAPVSAGTVLGPQQFNATATANAAPVAVPLGDAVRVNAFFHDGLQFRATGFDGQGAAYSYQQLGTALHYRGATFALGQPDVQNAASNNSLSLPAGQYSAVYLLGAAASAAPGQAFTLHYADGTATQQTLDLSAWTAATTYADETVVATTSAINLATGQQTAATAHVYGYTLPADSSRTLQSITLPPNPDVVILAASLSMGQSVPIAGSFTYTPAAGTVLPLGDTVLHATFTANDAGDLQSSQGSVTITALRNVLSVRADNASRAYGAQNPAFTGSIAGALGSDQFQETFATAATGNSGPGTYPITPAVNGTNLNGYQVQLLPGVLTVTRAAAVATLAVAQPSTLQGAIVTLTASVVSTTSGLPTGNVTFLVNGSAFATAALVQGVATFATGQLPVGTPGILASYAGDANFLPGTAGPAGLSIAPRDFLLTAPQGTTLTGVTGSSPSLVVHLAPLQGTYSADAQFTVSGNLPPNSDATFSPGHLPADSGPQDVVLTLHTRKLSLLQSPFRTGAPLVSLAALLGVWPLLALRRRLARAGRAGLLLAAVVLAGFTLAGIGGCGSGYAAHTYAFTVTATTGTVSHALPLTLQIQASPQ